jgi:peroxiredoxin Q/BCP
VRRFSELHGEFAAAGVEVIGASVDPPEKNKEFKEQEQLEYELVSDPGRELAAELGILKEYGSGRELAKRITYLLRADGTVARVWEVDDIDTHPDDVLAAAREL